jgi:hypothetical protein
VWPKAACHKQYRTKYLIFFCQFRATKAQGGKCHLVAPSVVAMDPALSTKAAPGVDSYVMVGQVFNKLNIVAK